MGKGRSLELYFVDGNPDGMQTAELFGWTGHVLLTPRTKIVQALQRNESGHTGIYVLLGENEHGPLAYVGESEDIGNRLREHAKTKDWWELAVLISSAANNLHKAHVKYLESRLVEVALAVGKIKLENGNKPTRSSLSEAATANMEEFLDNLMIVLPALRIDVFLDKVQTKLPSLQKNSILNFPEFELITNRTGVRAIANLEAGEMIVQAGSIARKEWVGDTTAKTHYFILHEKLLKSGVLLANKTHAVFQKNYAFSSPSAAGAVINGRSTSGPREWKLRGTKKTYAEWEAEQLLAKGVFE